MNLRKLLIITVVLLFLIIFSGTLAVSINNFRTYLIHETAAQTQNTASTLSFVLSQYADKKDTATMETMVDAIFETGNYQKIEVRKINNELLFSRTMKNKKVSVPNWFMQLTSFTLPPASGIISAGWKQYGSILIYSQTNIAYQQLWKAFIQLFWWFIITFLLTLIILIPALNYLLKPLDRVKKQAENISAKNFTIVKKLPWTTELRSVVEVMNGLSHRVKSLFEEQTVFMDKLRDQAYKDPLTKLSNRRYFNMQLEHILMEKEQGFYGALLLLEVDGLAQLKKEKGFEITEKYLLKIASILKKLCHDDSKSVACRLSDADFILLQYNLSPADAAHMAKTLVNEVSSLLTKAENPCKVHVGVAVYQKNQTSREFFSQADMALRAAQIKSDNDWYMFKLEEIKQSHIHTAKQWKDMLLDVIKNEKITLYFQPIYKHFNSTKEILQYEVLLRIHDKNGELLTAAHFLPMAENLNLITQIDQLVIKQVIHNIKTNNLTHNFAINIASSSLNNTRFTSWLKEQLRKHAKIAKQLIFEVPEQCAINQLDTFKCFISDIQNLHANVSIDQFGRAFSSVHYLQNLNISYLKIDGSFTHHIDADSKNQFFVHTLADVAHNLEIKVIALNIENEAEFETLKTFALDGYQGYFLGRPIADIN